MKRYLLILLWFAQLENFRKIRSHGGVLTHNFRPIQPLSSRPVWYNSGSPTTLQLESSTEKGGSMKNQISIVLFICAFVVPKLFI